MDDLLAQRLIRRYTLRTREGRLSSRVARVICATEVGMPSSIDKSVRDRVVNDYLAKKAKDSATSTRSVAAAHGVGEASLKRWLAQKRQEDGIVSSRGRPPSAPRLAPELRKAAVDLVLADPAMRLYEVAATISQRAGSRVSEHTIRRCLRAAGVGKRRLARAGRASDPRPDVTRYTDKHRRRPEDRAHRRSYPSDFTNSEWAVVEPLWAELAEAVPMEHDLRDVLDAIRYIGATGAPWRFLPHDYPPYQTVYAWFERWARDGTQEVVNAELRRVLRRRQGREDTPSLLIVDSQTAKSREGGEQTGWDGGKRLRGRKRHIAVDTMGLPWFVAIHGANIQDRDGLDLVVPADVRDRLPRLEQLLADGGYAGRAEARTQQRTGVGLKIARRVGDNTTGEWVQEGTTPRTVGFKVIPKRWIVERSNSWFSRRRRLTSDFERTVRHGAAWYQTSVGHILAARMPR
jgi:putative transposase